MTRTVWAVSALLFCAGFSMLVLRRQFLAMLLGLELMTLAVNISLVYSAGVFADVQGLAAALLIIAVSAGEAVVGLALILQVHRSGRAVDSSALRELRG